MKTMPSSFSDHTTGVGCHSGGKRWWASSTKMRCGRPVFARHSCNRGNNCRKNAGRSFKGSPTRLTTICVSRIFKRREYFTHGRTALRVAEHDGIVERLVIALRVNDAILVLFAGESLEKASGQGGFSAA